MALIETTGQEAKIESWWTFGSKKVVAFFLGIKAIKTMWYSMEETKKMVLNLTYKEAITLFEQLRSYLEIQEEKQGGFFKYHNPYCQHIEMLAKMQEAIEHLSPTDAEQEIEKKSMIAFVRTEASKAMEGVQLLRMEREIEKLQQEKERLKEELGRMIQFLIHV